MTVERLLIPTQHPFQCIALTEAVQRFIAQQGAQDGTVLISGQHTTTAVIINEMEERLIWDLEAWLAEIAPAQRPWKHNCLLYTSPSPRDVEESRMPSSA